MCLKDVESVVHLLVNCERSCFLWISMLSWFGCSWVLSCSGKALFCAWMKGVGLARGRIMWKAYFFLPLFGSFGKRETPFLLKGFLPLRNL